MTSLMSQMTLMTVMSLKSLHCTDGSDDTGTESSGEEEKCLMIVALEELIEEEAESEGCINRAETKTDEDAKQAKVPPLPPLS